MSFTTQQVVFLQRLVADRPAERRSETARALSQDFAIGILIGRKVEYTDAHFLLASQLLLNNDLSVAALGRDANRADVAAFGGQSEKSLSVAPHAGSIAIKSLGRCMLDGRVLETPAGSYLVMTPGVAERVACERLMLVENLETFRTLEAYRWLDTRGQAVLAVYRGDVALPVKDAWAYIRQRSEPVWSFCDFDPAGLAMANGLPAGRLDRIVLPTPEWVRMAADTERGRQLYDDQVGQYCRTLTDSTHPDVRFWWNEMQRLRSGVTQERMRAAPPGKSAA